MEFEIQQETKKILNEIKINNGKIEYPINPFELLVKNNTVIKLSNLDKLEGLLLYDSDKTKFFVGINANRPIARQRFTAAHELGHIILHSKKIESESALTCPIYGLKSKIEKEADSFASFLLMPSDELIKQVNKYKNENGNVGFDECVYIAEYFGVSFKSCVKTINYRLHRLEYSADEKELDRLINKYRPLTKRKELLNKTNDLSLLLGMIKYSFDSFLNISRQTQIKILQNLVYHDSRLENVDITIEEVRYIMADLRLNGSNSKYCNEDNKNIIEVLGNFEMNKIV